MKTVKIMPFLLMMMIAAALSACAANTGDPVDNTEISTAVKYPAMNSLMKADLYSVPYRAE